MDAFAKSIDRLIESSQALLHNDDNINAKTIEARDTLIAQLATLAAGISEVSVRVCTALEQARDSNARDVATMGSLLNKLNGDNGWRTTRRTQQSRIGKTAQATPAPIVTSAHVDIPFTDALSLPALRVGTFDEVKQDGEVYYVDGANHFAFRLGGRLFHGNIGTIYTDEKSPEKIKDCKFGDACVKQECCKYFHNPRRSAGSRDIRNYVASSYVYTPPDSVYKNRLRSRRFGSRPYLDVDIAGLSEEEITRFHDQAMHDLLCSMLLSRSYPKN
jgi:hypothetical protein